MIGEAKRPPDEDEQPHVKDAIVSLLKCLRDWLEIIPYFDNLKSFYDPNPNHSQHCGNGGDYKELLHVFEKWRASEEVKLQWSCHFLEPRPVLLP